MKALVLLLSLVVPVMAWAQAPAATPDLSDGATGAGVMFYRGGAWGVVRLTVINPGREPLRALAATSFEGQPNIQFATEVALPPRSRRDVIQPVRCPDDLPDSATGLDDISLLLDATHRHEQQWARRPGKVRLELDRPSMSYICRDDEATDTAIAMKVAAGCGTRASRLNPPAAPALAAAFDALDCFVLGDTEPTFDPAQLQALRGWVVAGGKLWIMLDQIDPAVAERLLRSDWRVRIIDRVELSSVVIAGERPGRRRDFERPVEMLRTESTGMEVLARVNGWPVALRQRVGEGWLLVTTLGPRAWVNASGDAEEPLTDLARGFIKRRPDAPLPAPAMHGFLASQIGYQVLDRRPVTMILALFVIALLASGVYLARSRRLEVIGVVGPGLALATAITFGTIGLLHRHAIPFTIASAQFVRVAPAQQEAAITGMLSVYSPTEDQGPIQADNGGVLWPDMSGQGGDLLRMVWTDMDRWQWRGLRLPSGAVRATQFDAVTPLPHRTSVTLEFSEHGMTGRLTPGSFANIQDSLLATPAGVMGAHIDPDGSIRIRDDGVMPLGRYSLDGAGASAESKLREGLYRRLLTREEPDAPGRIFPSVYPDRPVLLAWAESMNLGVELAQPARRRDSTLIAVPVEFARAAAGATIRIPSALLPFDVVRADRASGSTIYNNLNRQWIAVGNPSGATLRFRPPTEASPLQTTWARLVVSIRAPGWTLEVMGYEGNKPVSLGRYPSPDGDIVVESSNGAGFPVGPDGTVRVTLKVGEGRGGRVESLWEITGVRLDLAGQVSAPR